MLKKERKAKYVRSAAALAFSLMFGILVWNHNSIASYADGTATVKTGGKIREKASTSSEVLASVEKDDTLDVIAQTKDGSGYTWYKVYINSEKQGYIRADLVKISGTVPNETASNTTSQSSQPTKKPAATVTTETDVLTAKVTSPKQAVVRNGAGTDFDSVAGANPGTLVSVSGQAKDSSGKIWYKVSYTSENKTVTGFIRADLLTVETRTTDKPAVQEPVTETPTPEVSVPETSVPETPVQVEDTLEEQDYYLKYLENDKGEMNWYLFDNVKGNSRNLHQMLQVIEELENSDVKENQQGSIMKFLVMGMAVVMILLIIVIIILVSKLKHTGRKEEYEDEEEYEEAEYEDEEEAVTKKNPFRSLKGKLKKKEEVAAEEYEEYEEDEEEVIAQTTKQGSESTTRTIENSVEKTTNWDTNEVELDDDMEFEFLDL